MGFNIINDIVLIDDTHNIFAITNTSDNPTSMLINGIKVFSCFKRTKGRHATGDNCPFIFALKDMKGLTTTFGEIKSISIKTKKIIKKLHSENYWDLIVIAPSSHNINEFILRLFKKEYINSNFNNNIFIKKTNLEIKNDIDDLKSKNKDILMHFQKDIKAQIKENGLNGFYTLKKIHTKKRKHLSPLKINKTPSIVDPKKILIIDDIISSGTTIKTAYDILKQEYPHSIIEAFTLFSASK